MTFSCEKEGEEHGKKLLLSLCNGKWLMDSHGYLLVFSYLEYEKKGKSSSY